MDRKVIVAPIVSQRIGGLGLPREVLVRLLTTIHTQLAPNYPIYQNRRDPEDADCFRYRIDLPEPAAGSWHTFYMRVNDTSTPDHLFVETIHHQVYRDE